MSYNFTLYTEALALLQTLISIPSFSKEENLTADVIQEYFIIKDIPCHRNMNNIWATNKFYNAGFPTILLNSHHDTVKPNQGYSRNPFVPEIEDGKLYGLGSNDAGGCLVSLLATFCHFYANENLRYNLIYSATAEEEISGQNGIELIYPLLGNISFAIVGEPTQMNLAVAEKGLMVLDCVAHGKSGHAAREEGINALYVAIEDINWFRTYQFERVSPFLGEIKMTATMIQSGTQHNVVPDTCNFVVDVRITDEYSHEEVLEIIRQNIRSSATPRSLRSRSSSISLEHPIVIAGLALGRTTYGSPTSSDQALLPITSIKIGPGDSARSHTADEFIYIDEIQDGIRLYIEMLNQLLYEK